MYSKFEMFECLLIKIFSFIIPIPYYSLINIKRNDCRGTLLINLKHIYIVYVAPILPNMINNKMDD